jgi:hypothetical protein
LTIDHALLLLKLHFTCGSAFIDLNILFKMNFPKKSDEVAWRSFHDRTVILQLGSQRLFHELDEMGTFIWNLADGTRSVNEIVGAIVESYLVEASQVENDAQTFLSDLSQKGLITWIPTSS